MIDLTGEELVLAEKVLAEPELGNNGEPVIDLSKQIDLAMDTHNHEDDFRDQCEQEERQAHEAERQMIEHYQER